MSEPSREHIEAVAGYLHRVTYPSYAAAGSVEGDDYSLTAHAILTSTDPALLAAIRDLLVRAGRLHEEVEEHRFVVMDDARNGHWETKDVRRRFVSEWEEIES